MQFKSKWQREAIPKCINTWQRVEFCSTMKNQLKVVWSRRISKKKKSFSKSGKKRASESKRSKFSAKS